MRLKDGTVLPSFLGSRSGAGIDGYSRSQTDLGLRIGRVIATYPPNADTNTNKKFWEYDVNVVHTQPGGSTTEVIYPRCQLANTFGGKADFMRWRPRIGAQSTNPNGDALETGSRVYVLCVNGNTKMGIIMGGANNPASDNDPDGDQPEVLQLENMGVNILINQDGEFTLTRRGATEDDGTITSDQDDDQKSGAYIQLDKNGGLWLSTGRNKDNVLHLDSQNKKIRMDAAKGDMELNASSNVKITSSGVLTGDATDNTMMGTTYRNAETQLHDQLKSAFQGLQTALLNIGAQIAAAGALMVTPVVGAVAAAPAIAAAGAGIISAASLCAQAFLAITEFEAQSNQYLSKKNKSD